MGRVLAYDIDALVDRDDTVAVAWTGHLPDGSNYRGLSLYQVIEERIAETRQARIGSLPI